MTNAELASLYLVSKNYKNLNDFVSLVNRSLIAKNRKYSSKAQFTNPKFLKNYKNKTKRSNHLRNILNNSFKKFEQLNELEIYSRYLIWWTYTVFSNKDIFDFKEVDVLNDTLLNQYLDWVEIFSRNIFVFNAFQKSCYFIGSLAKKTNKDIDFILSHLIESDKMSTLHTAGNISEYAIVSLPDSFMKNIKFSRNNVFTKQLFDNIEVQKEYLLNILNRAAKNLIVTPVDFIFQIEQIVFKKNK